MAKVNLEISGIDTVLAKFKTFGLEAEKDVENITRIAADEIEADAKRMAPVDSGKLRQQIASEEVTPLSYKIVSHAPYSAYMEFGTGRLVSVPKGLEELASQFKGKGIREVNISPQPFMWPAFLQGRRRYFKDLKTGLERLINKNNK